MLGALVMLAAGFFSCGVERQDMKVLRDPAALRLRGPIPVTVEQLINLPMPGRSHGRRPIERVVVAVEGTVLKVKDEADGDLHVILAGATGWTMVVEMPAEVCTYGSPYARQMQRAREDFRRLVSLFGTHASARALPRLRFTGVVFFDRVHGQSFGAPNGIELHPVLRVERIAK